jgi:predicted Holliday junction resolvase-like endonuclease
LVDIVKVDGRREPFVREKVTVSALKSGAPPEEARAIGEAVERVAYDGMPSGEIRRRAHICLILSYAARKSNN